MLPARVRLPLVYSCIRRPKAFTENYSSGRFPSLGKSPAWSDHPQPSELPRGIPSNNGQPVRLERIRERLRLPFRWVAVASACAWE
jgi:hypothetical protein